MTIVDLTVPRTKIWMPDARPLVAHPLDDEFDGSLAAFNARWHKADPAGAYTHSLGNGAVTVTATGAATPRFCRYTQPSPGSEFVIYSKAAVETTNSATTTIGGVIVAGDLVADPSGGDSQQLELECGVGAVSPVHRFWSSYSTFGTLTSATIAPVSGIYCRQRVNGTSVAGDFSTDGVGWINLSIVTVGFAIARVGFAFNKHDAVQGSGRLAFFRCIAGAGTSGFNATRLGREMTLELAA